METLAQMETSLLPAQIGKHERETNPASTRTLQYLEPFEKRYSP